MTQSEQTGIKNDKEYLDRWWKPLVNPPITSNDDKEKVDE